MAHQIYAVIGDPVAHSLSPAMQNAALQTMKLDAEYTAFHVVPEDLEAFVHQAKKNLAGFNITIPHKNAVIPFLDEADPRAALAGSVNTVTIREGKTYGCSTDGYGFERAVTEAFHGNFPEERITFIGCGGVVRALTFHCAFAGVKKIRLLNRTLQTAEALCSSLKEHFPSLDIACAAFADQKKCKDFLQESSLAVQCTKLGLNADDPMPVNPEFLPEDIRVFDTIYRWTPFLCYAKEHRIPASHGLGMLLYQGVKSLSIWTGKEIPEEVMRKALEEAWSRRFAG